MHDLPRQKLTEIVTHRRAVTARFGRDVVNDAKLCEALLRDLCGDHRREISVLVAAQKERVAADLLASQAGVPHAVLLTRLTRRLQDNLALTEDAARWAVDSWALALGLPASALESQPRAPQAIAPLTPSATGSSRVSAPARNEMVLTLAPGVTMEFVRVPAGQFIMGSNTLSDREKPQHSVYLDDYFIGTSPVTVAQFAAFVKVTGHRTTAEAQGSGYTWDGANWKDTQGANWQHPRGPQSDVRQKTHHPVTLVSWEDTGAFCAWAAKQTGVKVRLPTEAEWEKAARGSDVRTYPWGNAEPTDRLCNFNWNVKDTTPVGQYSPQGDSPYGCVDMAGNVWEWCADWFNENYYAQSPAKNPTGPANGLYRVLRGGGWNFVASSVRASSRNWVSLDNRIADDGFRCAR